MIFTKNSADKLHNGTFTEIKITEKICSSKKLPTYISGDFKESVLDCSLINSTCCFEKSFNIVNRNTGIKVGQNLNILCIIKYFLLKFVDNSAGANTNPLNTKKKSTKMLNPLSRLIFRKKKW